MLLAGEEANDPLSQSRADAIRRLSDRARLLSLADQDETIAGLFLDKLDHSGDQAKAQRFAAEASRRVATAGRILIEQSDLLIAVWDGVSTAHVGGSGHTIAAALDLGSPVVWIDTANPAGWRILIGPEALISAPEGDRDKQSRQLEDLVQSFLAPHKVTPGWLR